MYYAGVDIGSLSADAVIIDTNNGICSYAILPTGADGAVSGEKAFSLALESAGVKREDVRFIVSTGYGRTALSIADKAVTEIACHGRGAFHLFPETRTILDIGGQDSKVIKLGKNGKVVDFAMNDKCAAGTGRFLEVMAGALEIDLEEMGPLSFQAKDNISISSMCTVFAESEVISLVAKSKPKQDIIKGIHNAIGNRVFSMLDRLGIEPSVTMTGGVAKNPGMVDVVREKTGHEINLPPEPQIVGALGAARFAEELLKREGN